MKKVLTLLLIGSFFAVYSCGPRTSDQPITAPEPEVEVYQEPEMDDATLDGDTVEVESDTTVVE